MSLSTQILDLYDDLGMTQLKALRGDAVPSFIKTAKVSSREEAALLPNDAFALHMMTKEGSRLRRFPVSSAADTWLSCTYFEKNAHKLPYQAAKLAATHLESACERFGIEPNSTVQRLAVDEIPRSNLYVEEMDMTKAAHVASIVQSSEGGPYALGNKYPLFNEGFVKKAAAYFVDYFGQFDPSDRHAYARNVLNRAEELGLSLDGNEVAALRKVAGTEYGDSIESQIRIRKNLLEHDEEACAALNKIADVKDQATPEQFSQLLNQWDQDYNMERSYGRYLMDPYQATYSRQMTKEAGYTWEDSSAGVSINGKELEKAASDKYDKIKGYFGATLADSLKKHGSTIFESLPSDAKVVIARIAKGNL